MTSPEWLIERGIGETRCALIEGDDIVEARVELEGVARAGSIIQARLVSAAPRNAIARDAQGHEYLLPRGSRRLTQGARLNVEVTREEIPGAEPWKRPLARTSDEQARRAPLIAGRELAFPAPADELGKAGWDDLVEQARSGIVSFEGGELRISPTPAMTLIDVDGHIPADELAIRGAAESARAIRRLAIGGSIGIDLPTVGSKAVRLAAAAAIDAALPQAFERTAVNGFGFIQIVRPRLCASLVELAQERASFEARALLHHAALEPAGAKRLVAHPSVINILEMHADWIERLSQQVAGAVTLRAEPALPISGGYAEQA